MKIAIKNNNGEIADKINKSTVVFWGTGRIATTFYEEYCLQTKLINKPMFWCDNDQNKYGKTMAGIKVISPNELFKMGEEYYKKGHQLSVIIAVTGTNLLQIICQLEQYGLKAHIYSAIQLMSMEYFNNNNAAVNQVMDLFEDQKSREIYQSMINNMINGRCVDFSLAEPNQYISNDVISELLNNEIMVDAGVCNGEEIDKALAMNDSIKIYAFEPNHRSVLNLQEKYALNRNVIFYEKALWDKKETLHFATNLDNPSASRLTEIKDGCSIAADALDNIIKEKVTLIKMDIEGAEYRALKGSEILIKKYHPKLAICLYHNIEDYIKIPLLIYDMNKRYKFYFRQHSVTSGESVLYAI